MEGSDCFQYSFKWNFVVLVKWEANVSLFCFPSWRRIRRGERAPTRRRQWNRRTQRLLWNLITRPVDRWWRAPLLESKDDGLKSQGPVGCSGGVCWEAKDPYFTKTAASTNLTFASSFHQNDTVSFTRIPKRITSRILSFLEYFRSLKCDTDTASSYSLLFSHFACWESCTLEHPDEKSPTLY